MAESQTVSRLESLVRLYRQGYRSPVVDQAVEKLVALEVERSRNDLQRLEERLSAYEKRHVLSSAAFYAKFRAGEMGDDMDVVEWSVLWEMLQATLQRLDELDRVRA